MCHSNNTYDWNAIKITKYEVDKAVVYIPCYHNAVVMKFIEKVTIYGKVYLK